ncbi:MAG TPA: enolase C-terminal domain-like protein [Flavobacteriales bacterium]|nr:enolase C-terminal domain-like protein [Flavobacteriales bacterium]
MAMVTLGHSKLGEIALKLTELPQMAVLKVKLGSADDEGTLESVKSLDDRPLFLDANQGWTSVGQAMKAIAVAGEDRVLGLEQPFAKERWDLHAELRRSTRIPVYGDESIQGLADLERAPEAFDGVNLKLVKCGGLDRAMVMAERAAELGLKVMLGSMSESSLGCGAMVHLAGMAELVDLDGPWLVRNDPFCGLGLSDGRFTLDGSVGVGVRPRSGHALDWIPIGA